MERDHRRRVPGICFLTKATLNINVRLGASLYIVLILKDLKRISNSREHMGQGIANFLSRWLP